MFKPPSVPIIAALVIQLAALVCVLEAAENAESSGNDVWSHPMLRAWCIIGSIMGAFIAIGIFPQDQSRNKKPLEPAEMTRKIATKFGASSVAGMTLTPMLLDLATIPKRDDYVIGCSCLVAIFAIGVLHQIAPAVDRLAQRWLKKVE